MFKSIGVIVAVGLAALGMRSSTPAKSATLKANIAAFERLLDHNPSARIVWLHAGWDLTGERTVPLMRGLLERHANLNMSVKLDRTGSMRTSPFSPDASELRPGRISMLRALPSRFVMGSDEFVDQGTDRLQLARRFVDALPADVRDAVGATSPWRIYRLSCPRDVGRAVRMSFLNGEPALEG